MSFGKANGPKRRHRPMKSETASSDEPEKSEEEEREDRLNSQMIPKILSVVGSVVMVGILLAAAPYSYGSQRVFYSKGHIDSAQKLLKTERADRGEVDPKVLIDFTKVILPVGSANTPALNAVAQACSQGRAKALSEVPPDQVHKAFAKATKHLTCAMSTNPQRFCDAGERAALVGQLMDYKEKRQNVMAFEKFRDKAIIAHEDYRSKQLAAGATPPKPLNFVSTVMDPNVDAGVLRGIEYLVSNGYLSPSDFGYRGMYVPAEYRDSLSVGADRYANCGA